MEQSTGGPCSETPSPGGVGASPSRVNLAASAWPHQRTVRHRGAVRAGTGIRTSSSQAQMIGPDRPPGAAGPSSHPQRQVRPSQQQRHSVEPAVAAAGSIRKDDPQPGALAQIKSVTKSRIGESIDRPPRPGKSADKVRQSRRP